MHNPLRILAALGLSLCLVLSGSAQQPQKEPLGPDGGQLPQPSLRKEHPLYSSLRDVINQGVTLYNEKADYNGCYRVYQGGLLAIRPYLTDDPELWKFVDDSLKSAEKLPRAVDRAWALRSVIDSVRDRYRPEGAKPSRPLPGSDQNKKPVETIPVPKKEKTPGPASAGSSGSEGDAAPQLAQADGLRVATAVACQADGLGIATAISREFGLAAGAASHRRGPNFTRLASSGKSR